VKLLREDDYVVFKRVLDRGKHPAFVGRETFGRQTRNGGALMYLLDDQIVAVSLVNAHHGVLLALNIVPQHRGHGIGSAIVNFLMPNFARVVSDKVGWFEKRGYVKVGSEKMGRSLKTQIMVRRELLSLAGRLNRLQKTRVSLPAAEKPSIVHLRAQIQTGRKTKVKRDL
jgi:GNAT superfamily N-acetyltransferase